MAKQKAKKNNLTFVILSAIGLLIVAGAFAWIQLSPRSQASRAKMDLREYMEFQGSPVPKTRYSNIRRRVTDLPEESPLSESTELDVIRKELYETKPLDLEGEIGELQAEVSELQEN
mgnify:CR=1 FL=1